MYTYFAYHNVLCFNGHNGPHIGESLLHLMVGLDSHFFLPCLISMHADCSLVFSLFSVFFDVVQQMSLLVQHVALWFYVKQIITCAKTRLIFVFLLDAQFNLKTVAWIVSSINPFPETLKKCNMYQQKAKIKTLFLQLLLCCTICEQHIYKIMSKNN